MDARGIEVLPSGRVRLRMQWRRHRIRGVFATVAEAAEVRDAALRELFDGTMVHRDDVDGICGLRPLAYWPASGGVYFCAIPYLPLVKIGTATNVSRRLTELRCGAPGLVLLAHTEGTAREERALHARFRSLRVEGEWFRLEGDLLALVRRMGSR